MKKILVAVVVLAVVAVAWLSTHKEKAVPAPIATNTTQPMAYASTSPITVDYTKLEKDTIYTEEEGKYENLPEEGQQLLKNLVGLPECETDSDGPYCYENALMIKRSSVVSLKNKKLLYSVPTGKGGLYLNVVNLENMSKEWSPHYSYNLEIRDDSAVVLGDTLKLFYYMPGMDAFTEIPNSEIKNTGIDYEYYISGALGSKISGKIVEKKLTISVFTYDKEKMGDKKIRDVIFDLSTLK